MPIGNSLALGVLSTLAVLLAACRQERGQRLPQAQRDRSDSAAALTHRQLIPLTVLPDLHAICRLDRSEKVPAWAATPTAGVSSISRTADELSIVVVDSLAPRNVRCNRDWRAFKVRGPTPVHRFVVMSGLSGTLGNTGIDMLALSTFETDYVMVKQVHVGRAERALRRAGYPFVDQPRIDSARQLPVKPVDEAVTDPEFFIFRARLQMAVAAHDTAEIMRIVDRGILNSFGGDGGREEFRERWRFNTPEQSKLWETLGFVLALGGRFLGDTMFYAPYLAGGTTGDGFETLVVLGANVTVHAGPGSTFKVIDTVSFEEVTKWRQKSATQGWDPIRTRSGKTGWVLQRYLRSPIGYRAGFVRREGRWWLRALVAGD
jgi:hypothetical protein